MHTSLRLKHEVLKPEPFQVFAEKGSFRGIKPDPDFLFIRIKHVEPQTQIRDVISRLARLAVFPELYPQTSRDQLAIQSPFRFAHQTHFVQRLRFVNITRTWYEKLDGAAQPHT